MSERLIFEVEPFEAYPTFEADKEEYPDTDTEIDTAEEEFGAEPAFLEWDEEARRGRSSAGRRGAPRLRTPPRRRPPRNRPRAPKGRPRPIVRGRPALLGGVGEPSTDDRPPEGSEYIRWVQSSLNSIRGLRLPVDGVMGVETRSAVRSFQRRQGLPVDGIVGPETERALIAARAGQSPAQSDDSTEDVDTEVDGFGWEGEVDRRSRDYVRWVQQSLNRMLGLRLAVDGIIGTQTRSAIRSFQGRRGLRTDGVVGSQTEAALIAAGAGQPPTGTRSLSASKVKLLVPTPPSRATTSFAAAPVEEPGGGRIRDRRDSTPNYLVRNGAQAGEFEVVEAASLGLAIFSEGRAILTSGNLSCTANTVSYRHENTPLTQQFTRTTLQFKISAHHPRYGIGDQHFWFRLSFEHNGYDIRNAQIVCLKDKSSRMVSSQFSITFNGQQHSDPKEAVAEILFQIIGDWDPVGTGFVAFWGNLYIKADGSVRAEHFGSEKGWVWFDRFYNLHRERL